MPRIAQSIRRVFARPVPWLRSPNLRTAVLALGALLLVVGAAMWASGVGEEVFARLEQWDAIDTWIVVTGALAAMACAAPGNFLVVRKLSMMGDAISHAALPGIVIAFVAAQSLRESGWLAEGGYEASKHAILLGGATALGVFCALASQWVTRWGNVESSAALGVVFTTLFALGLLLMRLVADQVDLDPDCVLYGTLENVVLDRLANWDVPRAAVVNGAMLLVNAVLIVLFFKELRICAFDPALANAMGIPAGAMHYVLMAVTAATLVAAFESVGSILVIAMLIVPPATALLLTERLSTMVILSLTIAALSALIGHVLAVTVPAIVFQRLGYPDVVDASTAGMMAAAAGLLFAGALLFSPRQGLVVRLHDRWSLRLKMAAEDVLGLLYREEERQAGIAPSPSAELLSNAGGRSERLFRQVALAKLALERRIVRGANGWQLTDTGRNDALRVVRAHRLWESYLAHHYSVEDERLHESAGRAEHFIDGWLRDRLAAELDRPERDPHGSEIPKEADENHG